MVKKKKKSIFFPLWFSHSCLTCFSGYNSEFHIHIYLKILQNSSIFQFWNYPTVCLMFVLKIIIVMWSDIPLKFYWSSISVCVYFKIRLSYSGVIQWRSYRVNSLSSHLYYFFSYLTWYVSGCVSEKAKQIDFKWKCSVFISKKLCFWRNTTPHT